MNVITITENEIVQGLQQYERAMIKLAALCGIEKWPDVGIPFNVWSQSRDEPWQVSFIAAEHYIARYGVAPWYDDLCQCAYCLSVSNDRSDTTAEP